MLAARGREGASNRHPDASAVGPGDDGQWLFRPGRLQAGRPGLRLRVCVAHRSSSGGNADAGRAGFVRVRHGKCRFGACASLGIAVFALRRIDASFALRRIDTVLAMLRIDAVFALRRIDFGRCRKIGIAICAERLVRRADLWAVLQRSFGYSRALRWRRLGSSQGLGVGCSYRLCANGHRRCANGQHNWPSGSWRDRCGRLSALIAPLLRRLR